MLGFVIMVVAICAAGYFILGKKNPTLRDKIVAAVMAAVAAFTAWAGDMFSKLTAMF